MKRLLTILLLFIIYFSFNACDSKTSTIPEPSIESSFSEAQPEPDPEMPSDTDTKVEIEMSSESEKPKRPESEILVIITSSGKKYHAGNCQYVNNNPNISFKYLDEAKREGYTACSKCEKTIENELLN